ncbi:RbsD/FucU family protein [Lederbergia citri]|uniref:Fucose isomerase n=1 Tax=Lederbergia citri TaxID=2833580 RepID=A0A942YJ19_9BACI|nr:RbsD/FucU domain-containing protein [Lederbergia citri]MBS4197614.1 fucose isomerase [Lederbergia citri]
MLKNIPAIISPELLKTLIEMGHGDEIVLADGNFPAASHASHLIRCDGHGIPEILDAILQLMPLDTYVEYPISLMAVSQGDDLKPVIWDEYKKVIEKNSDVKHGIQMLERFKFYEHAKRAYAIVASGESALYANVILKKGVIENN